MGSCQAHPSWPRGWGIQGGQGGEEEFRGERGVGQDCAPKMFSRAELNFSRDRVPLICAPKKQLGFILALLSKKGTSVVLRRKGSNGQSLTH